MALTAQAALAANPHWYHAIELAPGVVTPGHVDLRHAAPRVLPARLDGLRALDVGTYDGFWAFELEARGAEVVAIDLDAVADGELPPRSREQLEARAREWDVVPGRGFRLAAEQRGSAVRRVACDVMALEPEAIGGPVDLAFLGALLLHLRDPTGALERVHGALRPGGRLLLVEAFSVAASLRFPRRPVAEYQPLRHEFNWWVANVAALRAMALNAGFRAVRRRGLVWSQGHNKGMRGPYVALEALA